MHYREVLNVEVWVLVLLRLLKVIIIFVIIRHVVVGPVFRRYHGDLSTSELHQELLLVVFIIKL
jgi:hypothetical protein